MLRRHGLCILLEMPYPYYSPRSTPLLEFTIYVLVTDISNVNKTLVVHDPKNHASTCGAWFRAIMSKMGWSFTWHHYGTQPDSNTCGFRVVMLAMQWCQTNRLTGQLPRWFLTYCAGVLQLFADDTSSLRSTVNTFQDWAYECTLRERPLSGRLNNCVNFT